MKELLLLVTKSVRDCVGGGQERRLSAGWSRVAETRTRRVKRLLGTAPMPSKRKTRACQACGREFATTNSRRLFCTDTCRVKYHRVTSNTCYFCGWLADSKSKVTPHVVDAPVRGIGDTVNSCRECAVLLGDDYPLNFQERVYLLREKFVVKHDLYEPFVAWDEWELEDEECYSQDLREYILSKQKERLQLERRAVHIYLRYKELTKLVRND